MIKENQTKCRIRIQLSKIEAKYEMRKSQGIQIYINCITRVRTTTKDASYRARALDSPSDHHAFISAAGPEVRDGYAAAVNIELPPIELLGSNLQKTTKSQSKLKRYVY